MSSPTEQRPERALSDKNVDALSRAAGSEESIAFGKNIAIGAVAVGILGAVGAAMRPVWRKAFAANAANERVMQNVRASSMKISDAELRGLLERLDTLQARHRERHPMWYGELPPESADVPGAPR